MTMGVGPATLGVDVTIVNVDLPYSIAWTGRRFGVTSINTWTFTPDRDGTIMTSEEVFDGPAPQLLGVTGLRPMISRITESWMDSLQKKVEETPGRRGLLTSPLPPYGRGRGAFTTIDLAV